MFVRIRPGLELVWRTPTTLQIGVPDPLAVVDNVVGGVDWLVARLRRGATEATAIDIAVRHGSTRHEATSALTQLRPVLVHVDAQGSPTRPGGNDLVALRCSRPVEHDGACALVRHALDGLRVPVRVLAVDELPRPREVVVEIADFVVPPRRAQPLMSHDVPHTALIISDHSIDVTPLIVPGSSPCLRCSDLHRYAADDAWPTIASQLVGRRARTPAMAELSLAAGFIARVAASPPTPLAYRVDLVTGAATTSPWSFHAECGCRALPETSTVPGDDHAHSTPNSSIEATASPA